MQVAIFDEILRIDDALLGVLDLHLAHLSMPPWPSVNRLLREGLQRF